MAVTAMARRALRKAGQADLPAPMAAAVSTVAAGATPTKAEFDNLRADVVAVRAYAAGTVTALTSAGIGY